MDPSHSSLAVVFRILDRTTKLDSFLHTDLISILCGILYRINRIIFLVRRLVRIPSMVRPLSGRRTCLGYWFEHPDEYFLGTSNGVPQMHRRLTVMLFRPLASY